MRAIRLNEDDDLHNDKFLLSLSIAEENGSQDSSIQV